MISLPEIATELKGASYALFCHIRPDGDTIGSACGLKLALEKLGKKVDVYCADYIPERFDFLPVTRQIKQCDVVGKYDCYVAIDCAELFRLGKYSEVFDKQKNTFNIDHHASNTRYAKYNYVADLSSNSENIFDLINCLGVEIDQDIANFLMMGVATDTGAFRHKNVTENTFDTASKLKKAGADINLIYNRMFADQTKERALLFGRTMSKIRYFLDGKLAIATVRRKDFDDTNAKTDETEGFIDFVMGVKGVQVGICLMETEPDFFRASFRSKGPDVNQIAGKFGGGGHVLASGCVLQCEYEEAVDKLTFAVSQYIE